MDWKSAPWRTVSLTATAAVCVAATGCGGDAETSAAGGGRVPVVAAFYPIQEAAEQIGGDRVAVTNVTPIGGEPHDIDPAPKVVQEIEQAKLVLYLGNGFQPAVDKAVSSLPPSAKSVDLLEGLPLRPAEKGIPGVRGDVDGGEGDALADGSDLHVWVDPAGFIEMAKRIERQLIAVDPDGRATYEANGRRYLAGLQALDERFDGALDHCQSKVVVTSHAAFGYLTDRYGLTQAAIAGISPDEEPDPKSLAATAKYAKDHGVTTVFFESLVPKRLSETVANEIGATTDALNPVEGLTGDELAAGQTYTSIMDDNLRRLEKGLGCTAG